MQRPRTVHLARTPLTCFWLLISVGKHELLTTGIAPGCLQIFMSCLKNSSGMLVHFTTMPMLNKKTNTSPPSVAGFSPCS
jgi:hypothetical protein